MSRRTARLALLAAAATLLVLSSAFLASADPGPSLEITVDPPTVAIPVCTHTVFNVSMANTGEVGSSGDELRYVAVAAVLSDSSLAEFIEGSLVNAWILDPQGLVRWSGLVPGEYAQLDYADFGQDCSGMVYRLPENVALRGGERLLLDVEVHCLGEGNVTVRVFAPATEDHHASAPTAITGVNDRTNLYYWPGSEQVTSGWYPSHNVLDPCDPQHPLGHSFRQHTWTVRDNPNAYAQGEITIVQQDAGPPEPGPRVFESDCFKEQSIGVPIDLGFTVGHRLRVSVQETSINLGSKLLPGQTCEYTLPIAVWSNDEVEIRLNSGDFLGTQDAANVVPREAMRMTVDGEVTENGQWACVHSDGEATPDGGIARDVRLGFPVSYAYRADSYAGVVGIDIRQY